MRCPSCDNPDTKVVDSRPVEEGSAIRRRRECEKCAFRFSTYEEIEILGLNVIKRNGNREPYSREKLERGIKRAFQKREHNDQTFKKILSGVEQEIQKKSANGEIRSSDIGEIVMKMIRHLGNLLHRPSCDRLRELHVSEVFTVITETREADRQSVTMRPLESTRELLCLKWLRHGSTKCCRSFSNSDRLAKGIAYFICITR